MAGARGLAIVGLAAACAVACARELDGPAPRPQGVSPPIVCNQAPAPGTEITVTGDGFAPLVTDTLAGGADLALPSVALAPARALDGTPTPGDPVAIPEDATSWRSARELAFRLPPGAPIGPGFYDLLIDNPDGQSGRLAAALAVIPPPVVERLEPAEICTAQGDSVVTVTGRWFLFSAAAGAALEVDGRAYPGGAPAGCQDLGGGWQLCTSFTVTIPRGDLAPMSWAAVVVNPPPAPCRSAPVTLEVAPPPDLVAVLPQPLCGGGGTITVTGTGFRPGAVVSVDGTPLPTTFIDARTLTAVVPPGALAVGLHEVTVANLDGCADSEPNLLAVTYGAYIFFVDPPVVWSGTSVTVTIYGAQATGDVTAVAIQPHGDPAGRQSLAFTLDPLSASRVQALVPAGLAAGGWDVIVTDGSGCAAMLENGLTVVDTPTIVLGAVVPPSGAAGADTAVTITADTALGDSFLPTPRAYLSATGGGTARALRAVAFGGADTLTAVVPAGLAPGVYDLVVVNPDGAVGVAVAAFTVVASPPPVILAVTPQSIDSGAAQVVDVLGTGFDPAGPAVTLECRDTAGLTTGVTAMLAAPATATALQVTVPAIAADSVCVVRVTNPDGAYGEYSALAVTNPSSNLQPFRAATPMTTARRGLAAAAGRATFASRFLYAIGGDLGAEATALDSVEVAPIARFGELGAWRALPGAMTTPRTYVGAARIGRFLYAAGGLGPAGPLATVERAEILDPLDVPAVNDVGLALGMGVGLSGGTWVYRVSGLRDAAWAGNPGGETLPSDPVTVTLPALPEKIQVTLAWAAQADVVGYRVYRTATAGLGAGQEELVATVTAPGVTAFTDAGAAVTPGERPLFPGALGRWHVVATLATARSGPAVVTAVDPADPTVHYLYVAGGRGAAGALADYEIVPITVDAGGGQTVGAPVLGAGAIGAPRWALAAWVVDHEAAPQVPAGTTWVYLGGGLDAGGAPVTDTRAATVTAGGQLAGLAAVDAMPLIRAGGAGVAAAAGFLFAFGGGGAPSAGGHSAEICAAAGGGCAGGAPELRNWNNLGGGGIAVPRYLPGTALESAFIYVIGGATAGGMATATTERTVW